MERARSVAARLSPQPNESAISSAWKEVLSREPTSYEMNRATTFLAAQGKNAGGRNEAFIELIRALLNTNEFLYVD
jgi:hypothetical protein